jgi:A/G-specific adenine glycosylase
MDFTRSLLSWYRRNARSFPWRTASIDPYVVLVSEIMLQQTQAQRVAEALPRFLQQFPSVVDLARASNAQMIRQWRGMGYNSRALRLRDAAQLIVERHDGVVPQDVDALRALPGIGPYASASIAAFAFNKRVVVVDVNVRRVYSRWMRQQRTTIDVERDDVLTQFAQQVIPARASARWHHAVMDLGATICTARKPLCTSCPMADICPSANVLEQAQRVKRAEPLFRGEPQRLWRGRFVDALRDAPEGLTSNRLLSVTGAGALTSDEQPWFVSMIHALERDGVVMRVGRRIRLAD